MPVAVIRPVAPDDSYARPPTPTRIDELVVAKWEKLRLQGSELSDDAMFLRRVSLDITGTLPTPAEIKEFLDNPQPDKRQAKIESLLESPAYAAWWTTFFCDLTGNNTRQLNNVSYDANVASQQWYTWIYRRVADNIPYDQLVEGIVLGTSRAENESYANFCERMSDYFQDSQRSPSVRCRQFDALLLDASRISESRCPSHQFRPFVSWACESNVLNATNIHLINGPKTIFGNFPSSLPGCLSAIGR